eukprot:GHVQ01016722.1.p1 GENE.GHVQ01016722.1~~GHVQ01016722.1.p1  ORF type:complete len:905 (-),score=132.68 GHVQ01016722.1:1776-4490(-)
MALHNQPASWRDKADVNSATKEADVESESSEVEEILNLETDSNGPDAAETCEVTAHESESCNGSSEITGEKSTEETGPDTVEADKHQTNVVDNRSIPEHREATLEDSQQALSAEAQEVRRQRHSTLCASEPDTVEGPPNIKQEIGTAYIKTREANETSSQLSSDEEDCDCSGHKARSPSSTHGMCCDPNDKASQRRTRPNPIDVMGASNDPLNTSDDNAEIDTMNEEEEQHLLNMFCQDNIAAACPATGHPDKADPAGKLVGALRLLPTPLQTHAHPSDTRYMRGTETCNTAEAPPGHVGTENQTQNLSPNHPAYLFISSIKVSRKGDAITESGTDDFGTRSGDINPDNDSLLQEGQNPRNSPDRNPTKTTTHSEGTDGNTQHIDLGQPLYDTTDEAKLDSHKAEKDESDSISSHGFTNASVVCDNLSAQKQFPRDLCPLAHDIAHGCTYNRTTDSHYLGCEDHSVNERYDNTAVQDSSQCTNESSLPVPGTRARSSPYRPSLDPTTTAMASNDSTVRLTRTPADWRDRSATHTPNLSLLSQLTAITKNRSSWAGSPAPVTVSTDVKHIGNDTEVRKLSVTDVGSCNDNSSEPQSKKDPTVANAPSSNGCCQSQQILHAIHSGSPLVTVNISLPPSSDVKRCDSERLPATTPSASNGRNYPQTLWPNNNTQENIAAEHTQIDKCSQTAKCVNEADSYDSTNHYHSKVAVSDPGSAESETNKPTVEENKLLHCSGPAHRHQPQTFYSHFRSCKSSLLVSNPVSRNLWTLSQITGWQDMGTQVRPLLVRSQTILPKFVTPVKLTKRPVDHSEAMNHSSPNSVADNCSSDQLLQAAQSLQKRAVRIRGLPTHLTKRVRLAVAKKSHVKFQSTTDVGHRTLHILSRLAPQAIAARTTTVSSPNQTADP